jgi:hypothetical protein
LKSQLEIVLDAAEAELVGAWSCSTNFKPFIGSGYVVNGDKNARGDGKASATFRLRVPKSGEYRVLMAYSAHCDTLLLAAMVTANVYLVT